MRRRGWRGTASKCHQGQPFQREGRCQRATFLLSLVLVLVLVLLLALHLLLLLLLVAVVVVPVLHPDLAHPGLLPV